MADNKISCGSYDLNKWLYGGYEKGIITMLVGPPGSGKTNFVILAASSLTKKNKKVLFIDTEGGFSSERIKQIIGEPYKEALKNIILLEPTSFEEQKKILDTLESRLKKDHFSMIIVDGMAMLYRLELAEAARTKNDENVKQVNREIAKQMRIFSEIARKQKIPILITNQVYGTFQTQEEWSSGQERATNIVGGDLFKYWSKCIIELKNSKGKRKAILLKHRSLGDKEINFEIRNSGIFKRGWI
ncbi:DNA repair and recombination protein RadB [Candidatus Pacearchaeota archaeon]|nr:DNA repair and recombination protein RadB [Candidatus Pacearchaeota archaeon]